jgi:hypothetical protein
MAGFGISGVEPSGSETKLRVGTLWRCGDGLFFKVPPLASDALLTTLPLLENVNGVIR